MSTTILSFSGFAKHNLFELGCDRLNQVLLVENYIKEVEYLTEK